MSEVNVDIIRLSEIVGTMPDSIPTDQQITEALQARLLIQPMVEFEKETGVKRQTVWQVKQYGWQIRSAHVRRKLLNALFPELAQKVGV